MAMMQQQQQQQPNREMMMKQSQLVSDLQKKKMTDAEENGEVKRVKINPTETKLHMENIIDEEWKKISLGIEKQARAVHLKTTEVTETKVSEFGSDLKRTIINNPPFEFKPTTYGSKTATEPKQKKVALSEGGSRSKQDQAPEKSHSKRRRWDDEEKSDKGRKYDDDRRARQKQSPSYRSTKTPPRNYRSKVSPPRVLPAGRKVWSLKDDYPPAGKDVGRKAPKQSKDVIVIDDDKMKQDATAKGAEKAPEAKPSIGSSQPTTTTTTTTTAVASSVSSSFKFSWMSSKTAKPSLLTKTGVQYGPMPGRKLPAKGMRPSLVTMCTIQLLYIVFAAADRPNAEKILSVVSLLLWLDYHPYAQTPVLIVIAKFARK